jgi:hypothetical protein
VVVVIVVWRKRNDRNGKKKFKRIELGCSEYWRLLLHLHELVRCAANNKVPVMIWLSTHFPALTISYNNPPLLLQQAAQSQRIIQISLLLCYLPCFATTRTHYNFYQCFKNFVLNFFMLLQMCWSATRGLAKFGYKTKKEIEKSRNPLKCWGTTKTD